MTGSYEWEKLDKNPGNELVFGLALWTRNKGKHRNDPGAP